MPSPLDKHSQITTSQEFFDICGNNTDEVFSCLVIVDETWIRQYNVGSKRVNALDRKELMATVFWD